MHEYLSTGLAGGTESSETFGDVVLLAGTTVVDGAAVVVVDSPAEVDGTAVVVGAAAVVLVGAAGKVLVGVDLCCCSNCSSISSSKASISDEFEPPHADPTNNKQSKTAMQRTSEVWHPHPCGGRRIGLCTHIGTDLQVSR